MTLMMVTIPVILWIRHHLFELFYYHNLLVFLQHRSPYIFHTGMIIIPIMSASTQGVDMFILMRTTQVAISVITLNLLACLSFPTLWLS